MIPAYCGENIISLTYGWPDHSIVVAFAFDLTIYLTYFYSGKNSNLSSSIHKDIHDGRISFKR